MTFARGILHEHTMPSSAIAKRSIKVGVNALSVLVSGAIIALLTTALSRVDVVHRLDKVVNRTGQCLLDGAHGLSSSRLCLFAYSACIVSIALAVTTILCALVGCVRNRDTPIFLDAALHVLQLLVWFCAMVLFTYFGLKANANAFDYFQERVAVIALAAFNFVLFLTSVWVNAMCSLARRKNESVSMYV